MLDPYYLLGVELNTTPDDIRAAYRRRAAEIHPDLQPPEKREWASERMKQLNAARDLLLDPERRAKYDEQMRLEMEKARWRAKRDAYVPPANYYPPRRGRRGLWRWPFSLLALGWLLLICLVIVPLLAPVSDISGFAQIQYLSFAIFTIFRWMVIWAGIWLGPLLITFLLVAIFRWWKS
jgi:hypothetical protein